jgi:hypothetical protein
MMQDFLFTLFVIAVFAVPSGVGIWLDVKRGIALEHRTWTTRLEPAEAIKRVVVTAVGSRGVELQASNPESVSISSKRIVLSTLSFMILLFPIGLLLLLIKQRGSAVLTTSTRDGQTVVSLDGRVRRDLVADLDDFFMLN